jgi:DNA-binding SARP family transcriptional activator
MSNRSAGPALGAPEGADLRICLLGPPRVEWAGHGLTILRRQARALLYRLGVRLEPVPRDELCFLFWPDTPDVTAHRNLSHLLTHLRLALPMPQALWASSDQVGLDPSCARSDSARFGKMCAFALQEARSRGLLLQAIDLYRGPFLAGFSLSDCPEYENWILLERQCWERFYLETLTLFINECAAQGDMTAAIALAQRYLANDELAEEMHRRLMQLYDANHDRPAALRQFESLSSVLERELGVSPLPETRAVYQAILAGQPAAVRAAAGEPPWAILPSLEAPLIGREDVLCQMEQAYARTKSGQGQALLLLGEPGIGKTRLVDEFAARLQGQALLLLGFCTPGTQALPFQPVAQALRPAVRAHHVDLAVEPLWLAEASLLLPELREAHPNLPPPPTQPVQANPPLYEALCRLVLALAAGPLPCILFLDNLNWADTATLSWLAYLSARLGGQRLLVVGTCRSDQAGGVAMLRQNLVGLGVLTEITLVGLDRQAIYQLLREVGGPGQDDELLADRLHAATGGNPFFLLETLRALRESGSRPGDWATLDNLPLATSVCQVVTARLQCLHAQARQVLEAAAILASPFGFEAVRLTAGRRELETVDALEELVARGLLEETGGSYGFRNELVPCVVRADMSPVRRELLGRRAAGMSVPGGHAIKRRSNPPR